MGGHVAAHLVAHDVGHVQDIQAVAGQPHPVVDDLHLGIAALQVGFDVGQPRNFAQRPYRILAYPAERIEVVAFDLQLYRSLEAEQHRAGDLVSDAAEVAQPVANIRQRLLFLVDRVAGGLQSDGDLGGMLAGLTVRDLGQIHPGDGGDLFHLRLVKDNLLDR